MASIEYGIDEKGRKVWAKEAISRRTYTCPYCHDEIHVCKCTTREDYFAHDPIVNRTPQQMICPGYTGGAIIEDRADQVFITNGGLPLYLCEYTSGKYQLNAYFPPLGQESMNLLELWDACIVVTDGGQKEAYAVSDLQYNQYYKLKTNAEWIKIKCVNMKYPIPEVRRKWEWGIRGLDCEKDIFHSNYGGGYRVALHSNIVAGKEYLIVKRLGSMPKVAGINCFQKGSLILNHLNKYDVYSMVIHEVTDEAIAYIHQKGYQLIKQNDEIIPLWPPAVIEGKELIYRKTDNKAFLYHNKRWEQQLFNIGDHGLSYLKEHDDIFETSTHNTIIYLSDPQFNSFSAEIRFMLTQTRNNFDNEKLIVPNITWKAANAVKQLSEDLDALLNQKKVYIEANVDFVVCIVNGAYVEKSTERVLEDIRRSKKIVISMEPFGMIIIEDKKAIKGDTERKFNFDISTIIAELYRCNSARVPINKDFYEVYEFAVNNSEELLKILNNWAIKKQMPYVAGRYLNRIKEALKNE